MKPVFVTLRASEEITEIANYYEQHRVGLGDEFQDQLKNTFMAIRRTPDAFAYDKISETRKHALRKFPYIVHYLHEAELIEVVAVAHQRRKPGYWL